MQAIFALSNQTRLLLNEWRAKSGDAYPEGGLQYTYVEAPGQAHFRLPESGNASSPSLSIDELSEFGRFFQTTLEGYCESNPDACYVEMANQLMKALKSDLAFTDVQWSFEEGDYDMQVTLKMVSRSDYSYYSLELWWSVD
ncbi:hypothetical protein [Ralstonia insidiosa]|uniref:Uncharacterized protein n=1 Tax=Ralstonia insidiosa TaxID=190721 RepID=A0A848NUK2_9RALS|nr:hypothetical protein [Ralstonia insidiosa]NMV38891.1 hypothetical protein [Ralstonia insidiosa]